MTPRLLAPASIAIVGVSADPAKHGRRVLANLRKVEFAGEIWGVNPGLPEIEGMVVVANLADLPAVPDVVVSAVPSDAVPDVAAAAAAVGVGAVIVLAGGFAEAGAAGERLQQRLADAIAGSDTRVLGPNSGGVIVPSTGLAASFLTCLDRPVAEIRSGVVGLVTQSGGIGSYIHNLAATAGSGLAASLSTGNEADLDVADGIAALVDLEEVRSVALVVETVRNGPRFIAAIEAANAAGKPVALCHLGRSRHSAGMLATHTGALATDRRVLAGVCESLGVTMTSTPGELFEVAEVLGRSRVPEGPRVGVVTHSGGVAILLADLAVGTGMELPQPSPTVAAELAPLLQLGTPSNPLDMGAIIGGPHRFAEVVEIFSRHYDVVLAVSSAHPPAHSMQRAEALAALRREPPIVHLWMAGDVSDAGAVLLRGAGLPLTEEPRAAIAAVDGLFRFSRNQKDPSERHVASIASGGATWSEHESKLWLEANQIPVVSGDLAKSVSEAAALAGRFDGPVVVKVSSPEIVHKTRVGGVRTGVVGPEAAGRAFLDVTESGAAAAPHASIDGARVERQVAGIEAIVGAFSHPQFGAMVSVGLGGGDVEASGDVVMALAPLDRKRARRLVDSLPGAAALDSTRFGEAADRDQLAGLVERLGELVSAADIAEVEINPLVWDGRGWLALDAVVRQALATDDGPGEDKSA